MEEGLGRFGLLLRHFLVWLAISLLLIGLSVVGVLQWPREWGERVVSSVGVNTRLGIEVAGIPYRSAWFWYQGTQRLAELENRLSRAAVDRAELELLQEENESLRNLISGEVMKTAEVRVPAYVLVGEEGSSLNVGAKNGVVAGMIVLDANAVLVGRVSDVSDRVSLLVRPEDFGSRIAVRVAGKITTGVVEGTGKEAELVEVLQDESLTVGDILVTSGTDDLYPRGLVVGEVVALTGMPADVTKGGLVDVYANMDELVMVGEGN